MNSREKIYKPTVSEDGDYEWCNPVQSEDFERIVVEINGEPRQADWKPLVMQIHREDERGRKRIVSDAPFHGHHAFIFKPRAVAALGPLLRANGELLPVQCEGEDLMIYNPTRVLDALDEDASELVRFKSSGSVALIKRYAFRPDVIKDVDIFKIPNVRNSPTFVGQRFIDIWKSAGLVGLDFNQVWPDPRAN
jgi:hypothetical protein